MRKEEFINILKEEGIDFEDRGEFVTIKGWIVWIERSNGVNTASVFVEEKPYKTGFYTTNEQIPTICLTRADLQPMIDKYHKCFGNSKK